MTRAHRILCRLGSHAWFHLWVDCATVCVICGKVWRDEERYASEQELEYIRAAIAGTFPKRPTVRRAV